MPKSAKLIWIPRIFAILFILFISIFAFDMFGAEGSLLRKIGGFLIHLLPSFILLFLLVFTWKRPKVAGIAFVILSIVFTILFRTYRNLISFLLLSVPLAVNGILFYIAYLQEEKNEL